MIWEIIRGRLLKRRRSRCLPAKGTKKTHSPVWWVTRLLIPTVCGEWCPLFSIKFDDLGSLGSFCHKALIIPFAFSVPAGLITSPIDPEIDGTIILAFHPISRARRIDWEANLVTAALKKRSAPDDESWATWESIVGDEYS